VIAAGFGLFFDTPAIRAILDILQLAAASACENGPIGVEGNPAGTQPVSLPGDGWYTYRQDQPIFTTGKQQSASRLASFPPAYDMELQPERGEDPWRQSDAASRICGRWKAGDCSPLIDINQLPLGALALVPIPNFGVIDEIQSIGTSNFNSLQALLKTTSWPWNHFAAFLRLRSHSLDEVTPNTWARSLKTSPTSKATRQLGL